MSKRAWLAVMVAAALVLGVVGAAVAGNGDDKHPSGVVITSYEFRMNGDLIVIDLVASERKGCIEGRTVFLYRTGKEDPVSFDDRTNDMGRSKIRLKNPKSGTYYERLDSNEKCKGGKSQTIEVTVP